MSVEVMQAQSSLLLAEDSLIEQQSIMAPSPRNIASPRAKHSRNAHGGSIGRARASSNINESEVMMIRALCWILRHGIGGMGAQYGINTAFDVSGWADCGQILQELQEKNLLSISPTLDDLQALLQDNPRNRFELRLKSSNDTVDEPHLASSWFIRSTSNLAILSRISGTLLSQDTESLPTFAIYATSYANYARILTQGILLNTSGSNLTLDTQPPHDNDSTAEVLFHIDLYPALNSSSGLTWYLDENELQLIVADRKGVEKEFWKKIVGRKGDVGVLWEEGHVVKNVPLGLRGKKIGGGKGLKGRNGRAKGGRKGNSDGSD